MRFLRTLFAEKIRDTQGYCERCQRLVPAEVLVHDDAVWLQRNCPVHGYSENLLSRHAPYYRLIEAMLPHPKPLPVITAPEKAGPLMREVFTNVTERCNLQCPFCLADSGGNRPAPTPTLADLLAMLRRMLPHRPIVYLSGGEPTLSPDLFEWIRQLTEAGYLVKLLTNGIKLADEFYCRQLHEAGLRWVLLQFDSPDEDVVAAIRGRSGLAAVREQVLENLSRLGMSACISCMIQRDRNFDQLGAIIRYGFQVPAVRQISLLPARRLGRSDALSDDDRIDENQLFDAICEQTDGRIKRRHWLEFFFALSMLHRLTGSVHFKPQRCFLIMPLFGTPDRYHPATHITGFLRDPKNLRALVQLMTRGGRVEETKPSNRSLLLTMDFFHEPSLFDLGDVQRCTRFFLADNGLQHGCNFLTVERHRFMHADDAPEALSDPRTDT
jgi:uncharacterized radical SAM superfamily Fe-S cluster-containing enzyme